MAKKYNMDKIALDLLTCHTDIEVCEKNNISVATLFRLKKNDEFKNKVNEIKENLFSKTIKKSQAYCLEALDTLMEIVRDKEASAGHRITASCKILEFGQNMNEMETIKKKLEELEKRINENEENEL